VLLAHLSIQKSTLYVDTVEPNTDSVDIPYFTADQSVVISASTGRFKLLPDSNVEITTEGPVYLFGSFISLDSDGQISQTAEGSITLDATDAFVVNTNDLNITAENDVSMTTIAQELEINVGESVEAVYDTANITGASSVHLNSGAGEVEIFTDHTITNQASTTNVLGENRITLDALFDITLNAENLIDSRANVIDFDTLGDFRISSTTANVQFQSGSELIVESFSSTFNAIEGIDIASLHGDIYVSSGHNFLLSSLNAVDYEVTDDASFISDNGPITMTAKTTTINADQSFISDASQLNVTADNLKFHTGNTHIDSHDGSIQISTTSPTTYTAFDSISLNANMINTTSFNLFISEISGTSDVEFRSTAEQESYFSIVSSQTIKAGTDDFVGIYSGSIDTISNRIYMRAFLDLNVSAEHKTFDFVSMKSEDIHFFAGRNELISANIGSIEASTSVTFSSSQLLSINSSDSRGTTSFSAGNQLNITTLVRAVFGSTDDMIFNAWNFNFNGVDQSQFSSTVGNIDNYAMDIVVNAQGSVQANAADGISFTSNGVSVSASNLASYTAPQFDFWANGDSDFSAASTSFSVDGDLDFLAFQDLYMSFITALNSPTIAFESNERIELSGANIFASSVNTFNIESGFRSDISWTGTTYSDTAVNISDWTAPISNYVSYNSVNWDANGQISFYTNEEHPMGFYPSGTTNINTPTSDQSFNAEKDLQLFFSNQNKITSTGTTTYSAVGDNFATLRGAVSFTTTNFFSAVSNTGDLDFISDTSITLTTGGNWTVNANNNAQIAVTGDILFDVTGDTTYNVNSLSLTSTAISADENSGVFFDGTDSIDITLTGQFSQNGGSVSFSSADNTLYSQDTLDINSIDHSTFTISGNLTFDANTAGSNIRFQSMDYYVTSTTNIDFLGGDITLTSNRTQPIEFTTAGDTNIITDNGASFSWISRWDIEATMANFTVRANHMDTKGNSISFTTTSDKGDFVVFSKSGWINFESRDSQTYNAEFIELFAAGDLFFNTSLALSPATGGISFLTDGYYHNPKVGDNTGITFTTTGVDGFIYLNAPIGGLTFYSGYDMSAHSFEGYIDVLANQNILFSTLSNLLISSNDELTFLADVDDMIFQTLNGSTELRAYSNITFSAATSIFLTSLEPIQHTNGRAFEFSSNSGHIEILADSDSNIDYTAAGEFYIQSAETTSQYGNLGVYYNAFTGEYLAASKTGIKLMVQNGDLNVNASESIITSSGRNWDIFVTSGQNLFWNALTKNIDVATAENATIRTERKNVLFQTEVGNIFMDSTGQIRFESDGTDDNPGGSGVDGTFVIAPNIDVYATDKVVVESEGHVTIGANTKPIVKIEAGGDAAASGVEISAEGNVHFTIQEDVSITSGGNLYMAALKQFDMKTLGSISITTAGTDASGKDFTIRTRSEMDVNSQLALITGQERATVKSFQLISFITNGTDPITDAIKVLSGNDFTIDVDGRTDVNGNSTAFSIENDYNFLILGDLAFNSAGEITVYGDSVVDLVADTFLTVKSTGNGSHINFNTFGTNSDINIETEDETSSIIFKTFGPLTFTSTAELEFDTTGPQVFVAYDNIIDGVDDGDITLAAASDFTMNADSVTLEGAKGIKFTTLNKADIVLQSAGIMSVLARDDILFNSLAGKLTISATAVLTFDSYYGNSADFNIQSTRDIYLTAYATYFTAGNDFSIDAGNTVDFTSHSGTTGARYISFISEGADADMTFHADTFTITSVLAYFNGGDIHLTAGGTSLFAANVTKLHTTGSHNHISYISENDQLLITASNSVIFQGFIQTAESYTDYFHKGEGFLDWTASGKNPTFGYGTLLNATQNAMSIESYGNVGFLSNNFAMHSFDDITLTSSYGVADNLYATTLLAKGTDGEMYFNSSTNLIIDSSDRIEISAATQINFYPYLSLSFNADGYSSDTADIGRGFSGLIASLHPNGDIYFNTTDFLTGAIRVSSNIIETYGERGLAFHLQDDDDTEFSGEFQIEAPVISINGKNSGLVQSIGGGDIVFDSTATGGQIHLHAGDDIYFQVTNEFHIGNPTTEPDLYFDSRATLSFSSTNSDIDITNLADSSDILIEYSDDAVIETDGCEFNVFGRATFEAGSTYAPATEMRLISQVGNTYLNTPSVVFRTQRNRYVDFADGLIISTFSSDEVESYADQDLIYGPSGSSALNNWFFYEENEEKFCVGVAAQFVCFSTHPTNMYY